MRFLLILFILMPTNVNALTVDEWYKKYMRSCAFVGPKQVCKERLDIALEKMTTSKVVKILIENNLPLWIATVPVIESEYQSNAI